MSRRSIVVDTTAEVVDLSERSQSAPPPKAMTHMTLTAFIKTYDLKLNSKDFSGHGRTLSRLSRERGLEVQKLPDPRWGTVNAYDVELMKGYFKVNRA
jgi:hypothetical protein